MDVLPPPPPLPLNSKHAKLKLVPMARSGFARRGQPITLLTNHFKVTVGSVDGDFYHYSVALSYDDGSPVDGKGIGRKVIDKLQETYDTELAGKDFAYDGEKSLFTVGPLPQNKLEFTVILEDLSSNKAAVNGSPVNDSSLEEGDRKRIRRPFQSKSFKVEISYAAKIPMRAIANALRGQESENSQEALRVLDIILRQNAAKQGCLLVRQSFFHNRPRNFCDLGGGVLGCRGFHSSFRATQGGLSLNIDVSTTMIIQPGPVLDFLVANQSVRDPQGIDWAKARRMLKNLRINASPSNMEYKITGLSDLPCNQQLFSLKQRSDGNAEGEVRTTEVTVYDYFTNYRHIQLRVSGNLPCIIVGKPKRPNYIPLVLCSLVSLQSYTKALSPLQRSSLVEESRQKPQERMSVLSDVLTTNNYGVDALLRATGVSISSSFTEIEGRVLSAPKLKVGNGEDFFPRNGRWNYNHKKLVQPIKIECWAIVNFSVRCDIKKIWTDLARCGQQKGIYVEDPFVVIEEDPQARHATPLARVEQMFEQIKIKLPQIPRFLLCLLPEKKTSMIYGPWKSKTLANFGIVTQCISPLRVNDQYLTDVLLKINAKLGGLNSLLAMEQSPSMPMISKSSTMILGMDVSHGSPGQPDKPSTAVVVGSRQWSLISRSRASVRTQSPKVEIIHSLFKKVSDIVDEGIIRELLLDFYASSGKRKPDQIIIFRDSVSESQFNQVLNIELDQIIEACKFLDEKWCPNFTVIDKQICHPRNNDFNMCCHTEFIDTTRPTHYHVLLDEVGFSPDDLQGLAHTLSYAYQRSTNDISNVAPIYCTHLLAAQRGGFIKVDKMSVDQKNHSKFLGGYSGGDSRPRRNLVLGLENFGNTCFINAVLQIVANFDPSCHGSHSYHARCGTPCPDCLLHVFLDRYRKRLPLNLYQLTNNIECFGKDFVRGRPDSSFDFWNAIVEKLNAESFEILYMTEVACSCCGAYEKQNMVKSYYVGLEITGAKDIYDSLRHFCFRKEVGVCIKCEGQLEEFSKLFVDMMPSVLVVYIERLKRESGETKKIRDLVEFPFELDMKKYIPYHNEEFMYTLHGVIVHQGNTMDDGHYLCYVKANGRWFKCSDTQIYDVTSEEVLKQEALMLFYKDPAPDISEDWRWWSPLWWVVRRCCGSSMI